jgi:adenylate kinase
MTLPQDDQPHLEIGLNNQRSILHQLYNLVIMTTETREELERSWKILVQEEEREILQRQRRDERQDRRNQRLARAAQGQGRD